MPLPIPLWLVAPVVLLALGAWVLYEYYLHPAWRRQRRVRRACAKAFDEGDYQLERFRVSSDDPSAEDLFSIPLFGSDEPSRYFTYKIRAVDGAEPGFSGMDSDEIELVRRYLRRTVEVPHFGKKVLHPQSTEHRTNGPSTAPA
ncbi:MAG: hypothetical protein ABEL51_12035 [Salinibacter sp.]